MQLYLTAYSLNRFSLGIVPVPNRHEISPVSHFSPLDAHSAT